MSKTINSFLRYNRAWFDLNQESLLRLLNGRFTRGIARMLMRIRPCDVPLREAICQIAPNSFSYGLRPVGDRWQITTDFRTHPKYAKRIYFAMRPFLALAHAFDMRIANPFRPAWNLGWDTATYYPDANAETTSVDGYTLKYETTPDWSTANAAASGGAADDTSTTIICVVGSYDSSVPRYEIGRSGFLFDTSSLSDDASISSGVFSFYLVDKIDDESSYPADICLLYFNPTSNTAIATGDYNKSKYGSTLLASVLDIGSVGGTYNDMTLNASGISNISKTGISKFGCRGKNDYDTDTTGDDSLAPTAKSRVRCNSADYTGTTQDPKLVLTYTVAAGGLASLIGGKLINNSNLLRGMR